MSQDDVRIVDTSGVKRVDLMWIPVTGACTTTGTVAVGQDDPPRVASTVWFPPDESSRAADDDRTPLGASPPPTTGAALRRRWPVVLEMIPYRRNDGTAIRDSRRHPFLASLGYVCVRADLRGSGDSDGLLMDEYLPQELQDIYDVIEWLAAQPWSIGSVGLFGKSWGAFNAAQVATMRPPHLKAVVCVAGTHDRFNEDVHYLGNGAVAQDMLPWASVMHGYNAAPPEPAFRPTDWYSVWLARLKQTPMYAEAWLSHQDRDAYWRHGSVCEQYDRIDVPMLVVGGWADGYTSSVFRLLEAESDQQCAVADGRDTRRPPCLRFGLIGPWAHQYPDEGCPGPGLNFTRELDTWWSTWLKGQTTRYSTETEPPLRFPRLRLYLQDVLAPSSSPPATVPGQWIGIDDWPSSPHLSLPLASAKVWNVHRVTTWSSPAPGTAATIRWFGACGARSMGSWWGFGQPTEAPGNQIVDERYCWCTDVALSPEAGCADELDQLTAIPAKIHLAGIPVVSVPTGALIASNFPIQLVFRVCHVNARSNESTLLTWGCQQVWNAEGLNHAPLTISLRPLAASIPCDEAATGGDHDAGSPTRVATLRIMMSIGLFPMLLPCPDAASQSLVIRSPGIAISWPMAAAPPPRGRVQSGSVVTQTSAHHGVRDIGGIFAARPPIEQSTTLQSVPLSEGRYLRVIHMDDSPAKDATPHSISIETTDDEGRRRFAGTTGVTRGGAFRVIHRLHATDDPLSAEAECWHSVAYDFAHPQQMDAVDVVSTSSHRGGQRTTQTPDVGKKLRVIGVAASTHCVLTTPTPTTFRLQHDMVAHVRHHGNDTAANGELVVEASPTVVEVHRESHVVTIPRRRQ